MPLEGFGQRFQLNQTLGKLCNVAAEVGELDRVAEGFLKQFTSGDRMQFERKLRDPVEAMPTARLVLATNNRPRFSDKSSGLWRRMILVPFRITIAESERVRNMDKPEWWQQQGELPGILRWALSGLYRLRNQGHFTEPKLCVDALAEYRHESNPAAVFLSGHYTTDADGDIVTAQAYRSYSGWCQSNGYRALSSGMFGKEIVRAFPQATKAKVRDADGNRAEGYRGIRSNPDTSDMSDADY